MDRDELIFAIVGLGILNGLFSPFLLVIVTFAPTWYPLILPPSSSLLFYFASMLCSTLTILLGGVPAALYERIRGEKGSTRTSLTIWAVCTGVLTLPILTRLL